MTIIRAISDLHGRLPAIEDCDVLIIAGDICPDRTMDPTLRSQFQLDWLRDTFSKWIDELAAREIQVIGIAGNHDFVFEAEPKAIEALNLKWTYLCDSETTIDGLRFYGTPWVPRLRRWAFYANTRARQMRADLIPEGIDVLISHGPPEGVRDRTVGGDLAGDFTLNDAIKRVKPRLFICGHIHEGHGESTMNDGATRVLNVAYLDERYEGEYFADPIAM